MKELHGYHENMNEARFQPVIERVQMLDHVNCHVIRLVFGWCMQNEIWLPPKMAMSFHLAEKMRRKHATH